jgi:hypothetical protein
MFSRILDTRGMNANSGDSLKRAKDDSLRRHKDAKGNEWQVPEYQNRTN